MRSPRDHLVLEQPRDVIEFPVDAEIDLNGWDLRKALLLALNGNAVVVEWAKSPIAYEEQNGFRGRLSDLLDAIVDPSKVSRHYLGLARAHLSKMGSFSSQVKLKKLFYLLRPLISLDWMAERGFAALPPMNLVECLDDITLPIDAETEIRSLIERKSRTRELGEGPIPSALARYLEARYGYHEMNTTIVSSDPDKMAAKRALANNFYREIVMATLSNERPHT